MSSQLVAQFSDRATALGVRVTLVDTVGELGESVTAIADGRPWCAWGDPLIEANVPAGAQAAPAQADVSIVHADVGIAETGSLGFVHGAGRPRAVALLPPAQIVLLEKSRIVGTVSDALQLFYAAGDDAPVPASFVLVTGPSRTADIELHPLTGVHSAKEIDVVLLT